MRPRTAGFLVVVTALGIAGVLAGAASPTGARQLACTTAEGSVLAFATSAGHSCPGALVMGLTVRATETLNAGNPGQLTFHTNHLYRCIEYRDTSGSSDVVLPSAGVALKHRFGKTWCLHRSSDKSGTTLTAPGVVIKLNGTVFGLDSTSKGTLIKVSDGTVLARSTATGEIVKIAAGNQAFIPVAGKPQQPVALAPDSQDLQAELFLPNNVLSMGRPQPPAYLKLVGQNSLIVVGDTPASLKAETVVLRGFKLSTMTAAQLQQNPNLPAVRAKELRARTILAVGTFANLQPALKTLIEEAAQAQLQIIFTATDE